ncbi:hypothetical protein INT48_008413 [Thamnidium elegans]|uniref:Uncharacterized protein n=1 Tax=Thamnidium elegans TaxID=101142 RepID=A0A8H7VWB6_9FUNG|nr:hypothetical protein INT48_008413 [Thamnidium elegans]
MSTTSSLGKRKHSLLSNESSPVSSVVSLVSSKVSSRTGSTLNTPCQLPPISRLLLPPTPCYIMEPVCVSENIYMPVIPYYYHHKQFGIEACMLQLEAQTKFNNYYYL